MLRELLSRQHSVHLLLRPCSDTWRITESLGGVTICWGDMCDEASVVSALQTACPDAVCHLAWRGVGNRNRNASWQIENAAATLALMSAAADAECRHFVALGSQAEYGPIDEMVDEERPPNPTTLYGAAKLSAWIHGRIVCSQAHMRLTWLRLFSLYGPMDNPGWLIPSVIAQLLRGERPALTAGEQKWDYLHVDDAARALCEVLVSKSTEGVYNLGSGTAVRLQEIVATVRALIDPSTPLGWGEIPYAADQIMHLEANIAKLTAATCWRPAVTLREGLEKTVDWYRQQS